METIPPASIARIPEPSDFQRAMMQMMPPLKKRQPSTPTSIVNEQQTITQYPTLTIHKAAFIPNQTISFASYPQIVSNQPQQVLSAQEQAIQQKNDHKERNRLAAQKWRAKKDESLSTLEEENDVLRKKVFDLQAQALQLSTENNIL